MRQFVKCVSFFERIIIDLAWTKIEKRKRITLSSIFNNRFTKCFTRLRISVRWKRAETDSTILIAFNRLKCAFLKKKKKLKRFALK